MEDANLLLDDKLEKFYLIYKNIKLIFTDKFKIDFEKISKTKFKDEKSFIIQCCKYIEEDIEMKIYLHSKEFSDFTKVYPITKDEFNLIYLKSCEIKREEFLSSPALKKIVSETLSELPNCLARVYNINLGLETKADGTEITLKEFSLLNNEDLKINQELLESAKNLLTQKIKRKLGRNKL